MDGQAAVDRFIGRQSKTVISRSKGARKIGRTFFSLRGNVGEATR